MYGFKWGNYTSSYSLIKIFLFMIIACLTVFSIINIALFFHICAFPKSAFFS